MSKEAAQKGPDERDPVVELRLTEEQFFDQPDALPFGFESDGVPDLPDLNGASARVLWDRIEKLGKNCTDLTEVFHTPFNEKIAARREREKEAISICSDCAAIEECRTFGRINHEIGIWGGEDENDREAAGYKPNRQGPIGNYPKMPPKTVSRFGSN